MTTKSETEAIRDDIKELNKTVDLIWYNVEQMNGGMATKKDLAEIKGDMAGMEGRLLAAIKKLPEPEGD